MLEERLQKDFQIAYSIVENVIGKETLEEKGRKIVRVGISPRATKRNGICKYIGGNCIIEVSKHLFINDKEVITTLIHEILHTLRNTKGHDYMWQKYAKMISNNTEYNITRTRNIEGYEYKESNNNYKITCKKCGRIWLQNRLEKRTLASYKRNGRYHKTCGGKEFRIEDLRTSKILVN